MSDAGRTPLQIVTDHAERACAAAEAAAKALEGTRKELELAGDADARRLQHRAAAVGHTERAIRQDREAATEIGLASDLLARLAPAEQATAREKIQQAAVAAANASEAMRKAVESLQGSKSDPIVDSRFGWWSKEYETLARQWEELWKAGAASFSYLAVAAAAILTFGTNQLQLEAAVALAYAPILAWLVCILFPFKKYGSSILSRLEEIEKAAGSQYGVSEGHFAKWQQAIGGGPGFVGFWRSLWRRSLATGVVPMIVCVIAGGVLALGPLFGWVDWTSRAAKPAGDVAQVTLSEIPGASRSLEVRMGLSEQRIADQIQRIGDDLAALRTTVGSPGTPADDVASKVDEIRDEVRGLKDRLGAPTRDEWSTALRTLDDIASVARDLQKRAQEE